MKRVASLLIVAVVLISARSLSAQETRQPFAVTVSVDVSTTKPGSPIRLRIVLTNINNAPIQIVQTDPTCDYAVRVWNSHNKDAPDTERGADIKNRAAALIVRQGEMYLPPCSTTTRAVGLTLRPKQTVVDYISVDNLYDLRGPDIYSIQVEREIPRQLGGGDVKSNIVNLTVSE